MPTTEDRTSGIASVRRRLLLSVFLFPFSGCSWSLKGISHDATLPPTQPPARWTAARAAEIPADPPVFRQAAFRMQSEADSAALVDVAEGLIDSATELPAPVVDAGHTATTADEELPGDPGIEAAAVDPQQIDLATALGMAGGNAWTIQLARHRTVQAHADVDRARALWLPSLQFGVGWNKHDGRIQATDGQILEAGRNSLFLGGGATLGSAPVAGGSGGPFRLFADLELADAFFEPKIANRSLEARRWGVSVAKNQALLQAGIAYVDLVESAGQVADAQTAIAAAEKLVKLTQTFEQAGAGAQADVDRAATEHARLQQDLQNARRMYRVRSATLARRLRIDPRYLLHPADQFVVPIELTAAANDISIDSEIATALSARPEVSEQSNRIAALCLEVKKENVAPWIPYVTMATSAGMFGGGRGTDLTRQASRSDVDLQALWELDSLGLGVIASRKSAGSRLAQQRIQLADLRDQITAEVVQAFENVWNYRIQIETAEAALALSHASYERNLQRVRADEGLPIELLQAINARAEALRARTAAVAAYNRAQLELLYVTGHLRG